ncbi:rhodanese-like domain-containing protein [Hansschlegelia beijingensis]|uniref:rhodanese-like domain-containing protein n=1 Tax=Hansschlegelia beijingensis TaxID=1133344 RepID=UPI00380077FA
MTITSARDLVRAANAAVRTVSGEEAAKLVREPGTVLVDLREQEELARSGVAEGAVHVPRGLLEFQADPASPSHRAELSPDATLVLYCGSGARSALAAETLGRMGFSKVAHVAGGFAELERAGVPIRRA